MTEELKNAERALRILDREDFGLDVEAIAPAMAKLDDALDGLWAVAGPAHERDPCHPRPEELAIVALVSRTELLDWRPGTDPDGYPSDAWLLEAALSCADRVAAEQKGAA